MVILIYILIFREAAVNLERLSCEKGGAKVNSGSAKAISCVSVLTLGVSAAAILGGLLHLTAQVGPSADNIFGIFFLSALAALNLLVYLNDRAVARDSYSGLRLHRRGYLCLAAVIGGLLMLLILNLLVAALYSSSFERLIFIAIYAIYFGIPILGSITAWETLAVVRKGLPLRQKQAGKTLKTESVFKKLVATACYLLLIAGAACCYFLLVGDRSVFFERAPQFVETLLSGFALYHAFIYLTVATLTIKLQQRPGSAGRVCAGILGLLCFAVYLMPLIFIQKTVNETKAEFTRVFGVERLQQQNSAWEGHFLKAPFSLPAYFLGMPPGEYRCERDVVFYQRSGGEDKGLKLYYDVFMPPAGRTDLPGWGTALIRIHGGAWIAGDKGFANMMQVNKYFAAQGYTVFDVQYGLTDLVRLTDLQSHLAPQGLVGPYTLDDMIRHLGIFTKYLADYAKVYDLNLDTVFLSGGSAGGQLTTAAALALSGDYYPHLFSDQINIRGFMPLYPAIQTSFLPVIGEADEWIDVGLMVDRESPPCLIYQGKKDGMVSYRTARRFQEIYRAAGNDHCAVLEFDLSGHAGDFYFPGYFNQIWIYYMERFMALYR